MTPEDYAAKRRQFDVATMADKLRMLETDPDFRAALAADLAAERVARMTPPQDAPAAPLADATPSAVPWYGPDPPDEHRPRLAPHQCPHVREHYHHTATSITGLDVDVYECDECERLIERPLERPAAPPRPTPGSTGA